MKKLIVLSVVFALVATAAFAVDLGGAVFANATLASGESGDNASDDIGANANFKRVRLEGYGEAGDGAFGGWIRVGDTLGAADMVAAYAFWKPIDQLKVLIGGNPDGMYGKEGVTGWSFYQTPYDSDVTVQGNVWGWGPNPAGGDWGNGGNYNLYGHAIKTRNVFYGGFGGNGLHLNISPVEIFSINIVLPFFDQGKTEDVFKNLTAQVDVKLDFGNIAVTFESFDGGGNVFAYFNGSFGDLALDVGLSAGFNDGDDDAKPPIGIGLGLKYATDAFGVKFRTAVTLAGGDKATRILADVLPYFPLGDNIAAFISFGIGLTMPDEGDSLFDWHFNPFLTIGEEWGAKFIFGVKAWSNNNGEKINWGIPLAIQVNF